MAMSERDRNHMGADDPADAGLSHLYRQGAQEAPPPHLDAAIRAAARREVGAAPRRAGTIAGSRWRLPFALAAVLVLSVSLVTLMMEEGADELSAPPAPKPTAPAAGDRAAGAIPPPAVRPKTAPTEELERKRETQPAAAPPARAPEGVVPGRAARQADEKRDDQAQPSTPPAEAAARPFPAAPAAGVPTRPQAEPSIRERAAAPEREKPAPLAQRAPAVPAEKVMAEESRAATAGALRREVAADEATPRASVSGLSTAVARQVQQLDGEPPDKWRERIALLRREGRIAEADELLGEYQRRFPGHPLPATGQP